MGILGGWWQLAWFWTSLVLFFAIALAMTPMMAIPYNIIVILWLMMFKPF